MGKRKAVSDADASKKATKKARSRKVVVESPWYFGLNGHPDESVASPVVMKAFETFLVNVGFSEWADLRRVRLRCLDAAARQRFIQSKQASRSFLAIGFNDITRNLQKSKLSFVIVPAQSKPSHLLEALALCCLSANVPVVVVEDTQLIAKLLKVSSCFAVGVRRPVEPTGDFLNDNNVKIYQAHVDFVNEISPYTFKIPSDLPQLAIKKFIMSRGSTSCCDDVVDDGEEKFHPFIQAELETLNLATQSVNTLEARLEETRILFIEINKERTVKLDEIVKKIGKCIEKARPFYEAKARQRAIQTDVQRAAQMFERACSTVEAAKEMVQLAEQSVINLGTLDGNWQEVLNHATERVLKAEKEKEESQRVHRKHAEDLAKVASFCISLERSVKNCINKSAAYFELLQSYNDKLEVKKVEIRDLENNLQTAKQTYSLALSTLENISNVIHKRRQYLREKRLQQNTEGDESDDRSNPLSLDVPDLIRQLSAASPRQEISPSSGSSDSVVPPSLPSSLSSHQTVPVGSSGSSLSSVPTTASSPFTYPPSLRSVTMPLKPSASSRSIYGSAPPFIKNKNGAIRAGVVIDAADLLRSVGLLHLADTMPNQSRLQQPLPRQQQQQQQQHHQQQQQKPSKGLTSSSSSYSLPTVQAQSPATVPRSNHTREANKTQQTTGVNNSQGLATPLSSNSNSNTTNGVTNPAVLSWPSPSLSEVSSASSTTGSHRRVFRHNHSGRSSDAEDLPGEDCRPDSGGINIHSNVSNLVVITPVSLDSNGLNAPGSTELSHAETEARCET